MEIQHAGPVTIAALNWPLWAGAGGSLCSQHLPQGPCLPASPRPTSYEEATDVELVLLF